MTFNPDNPHEHQEHMQYNPNAKRPSNLLPAGIYSASVEEATETTSKAGNPMVKLNLCVYVGAEGRRYIKDYIVTGGEHPQDWKLRHLVEACNLPPNGEVNVADFIGRTVSVKVKIKPARGQFEESNAIDDYKRIVPDGEPQRLAAERTPAPPAAPVDDAEIPF